MSHTAKLWADFNGECVEVVVGYIVQDEIYIDEVRDGRVDITSLLTAEETKAIAGRVRALLNEEDGA